MLSCRETLSLVCVASALLFAGAARGQELAADLPAIRAMRDDARLHDVFFIDAQRGWAVGDRGVVWSTADGGEHWKLEEIETSATLKSVCFVSPEVGWAAGGEFTPITHASRGVLLQTRDGGKTWIRDKAHLLPGLSRVKFLNSGQGFAAGEASLFHGSGIFTTDNGGGAWSPMKGRPDTNWVAADFINPLQGAAVSAHGGVAAVEQRMLAGESPPFGLRRVHDMRLNERGQGWLVGDGGLLLATDDCGRSWREVAAPSELAKYFDWRAVDVVGSHCWVAGAPGTKILHSPDRGVKWEVFDTGHAPPWEGIDFVDEQRGWAVGALGAIFATTDGGRTWRKQHAGGDRAAVAGFFSDPRRAPFEAIASLGANEGYFVHVEFMNRRDMDPAEDKNARLDARAHDAVTGAGGTGGDTAWQFPVRQDGLALSSAKILEDWWQFHSADGQTLLEEYLVRRIRTWRPELVITHAPAAGKDAALEALIQQTVVGAARKAADPQVYPEQLSVAGLKPWRVSRIAGSLPEGQSGEIEIVASRLADRLGQTLQSFTLASHGLVEDRFRPAPDLNGFMMYGSSENGGDRRRLMGGVGQQAGDARRVTLGAATDAEDLLNAGMRQRNMQGILERAARESSDPAKLVAAIGQLTQGLDANAAGNVVLSLGAELTARGEWEGAASVFELFATVYPAHPFAESVNLWLLRHWGSAEGALLERGARESAAARDDSYMQRRLAKAQMMCEHIREKYPLLALEPAALSSMGSVLRRSGDIEGADKCLAQLDRLAPDNPWRSFPAGERWLARSRGDCPRTAVNVRGAIAPPKLDGELDEEMWRSAAEIELRCAAGDDGERLCAARIARDAEFLYIAVDCRNAVAESAAADDARPTRDADLSMHDRMEFLFDVDRDGGAFFRLACDRRGSVLEECRGDRSWNPVWYVAARGEPDHWTAEIAISIASLKPTAVESGDVWGFGAQRVTPGAGFQSWTTPASVAGRPEGFGYLLFE